MLFDIMLEFRKPLLDMAAIMILSVSITVETNQYFADHGIGDARNSRNFEELFFLSCLLRLPCMAGCIKKKEGTTLAVFELECLNFMFGGTEKFLGT